MELVISALIVILQNNNISVVYDREACQYDKSLVVEVISNTRLGFCKSNLYNGLKLTK